jgi:hypothetical protein
VPFSSAYKLGLDLTKPTRLVVASPVMLFGGRQYSDAEKERLKLLDKKKKIKHRKVVQDWEIWVGQVDGPYGEFFITVDNLFVEDLANIEVDYVFHRISRCIDRQLTLGPEAFFLQYKLALQPFPVKIELKSALGDLKHAFETFGGLPKNAYSAFGPRLVLQCRKASWVVKHELIEQQRLEEALTGDKKAKAIHGRTQLTHFLAKRYVAGNMQISELSRLMELRSTYRLGREVYALLPKNVQSANEHLIKVRRSKEPSLETLWKEGKISLEEYAAKKHPDLAKKSMKVDYPLPYEPEPCVVCSKIALKPISCPECDLHVCPNCAANVSLLTLHPTHCLKFGKI